MRTHVPKTAMPGWIEAEGLPAGVRGGMATRRFPGVSEGRWGPANFGEHSGDDPEAVACNRACLIEALSLPSDPLWLRQVHGVGVWVEGESIIGNATERIADASVVRASRAPAVILSADCLPILLASDAGDEIAAIHAGWRGLAAGVIENTLSVMHTDPRKIVAWMGPAIGQAAFEVGPEVRAAMLINDPHADRAFQRGDGDRLYADIYQLARNRLELAGCKAGGAHFCTVTSQAMDSYRRDGAVSGRMATLIWRV